MSEHNYVANAVDFAMTGKPIDFEGAVRDILAGKVQVAIDNKREEVARKTFPDALVSEPEVTDEPVADENVEPVETPAEEDKEKE